jgi:hypothetical protein
LGFYWKKAWLPQGGDKTSYSKRVVLFKAGIKHRYLIYVIAAYFLSGATCLILSQLLVLIEAAFYRVGCK